MSGKLKSSVLLLCISFLLFFSKGFVYATDLNPGFNVVYNSSLTLTWDNYTGASYIAVISTVSDFSNYLSSETLTTNTTTYTGLTGNLTYYFKVKLSTEDDTQYVFVSTLTHTETPYAFDTLFNLQEGDINAMLSIDFTANNSEQTTYEIDYSSDNFVTSTSAYITGIPPLEIHGLLTNTTYSFRIRARDLYGRYSDYSQIYSTQTVSKLPDSFSYNIFETSATFNWTPVNGINEYGSSGYLLNISTEAGFKNYIVSFTTDDVNVDSFTVTSLDRNTTYYYRFATLNSNNVANYINDTNAVFYTLTSKPSGFTLINITSASATLGWNAFPLSPSTQSAAGYLLEASTSTDFTTALTSTTYDLGLSTLTLENIDSNTTYYFRVAALNVAGDKNYSDVLSSTTLSTVIESELISYTADTTKITANYPNLPSPSESEILTSYGYRLDASSTNFTTGIIYSSYTADVNQTSLTVEGLRPNTTYYLRLMTFNRNMTPNYSGVKSVVTLIPPPPDYANVIFYSSTVISVSYSTNDADGYILELGDNQYFQNILASSLTYSNDISTLSISGLSPNTKYHIRLGSIFNGATDYVVASPDNLYTLTPPVSSVNLNAVYITSATLSWTTVSCEGYSLEFSTSSFFDGVIISSVSKSDTAGSLSGLNLTPNTSYYIRVGSINKALEKNYVVWGVTSTLANFPIQTDFTNNTTYSLQVNWDKNSNPDDTLYIVEFSSYSDFSFSITSNTFNNYVYFSGLNSNTTYYSRVSAVNRLNRITGPVNFNEIATLAYKPENLTVTSLSTHTMTLSWTDTNNSAGTPYLCEISTASDFSSVISSYTLNMNASFDNLLANTSYFIRVSAINFSNLPSEYEYGVSTVATYVEIPGTPTFSQVLLDGFVVSWDNNTNSPYTVYVVQSSTDSNFSVIATSVETTSTTLVYGNLDFNTEYYIRIKAKGVHPGNESDWTSVVSQTTLAYEEKTLDHKLSNTLSLPYSYGDIEVEIPPYTLSGVAKLHVEPVKNPPGAGSKAGILKPTGFAIRIYIFPYVKLNGAVKIKIPFNESNLPAGIDKNKLVIARYSDDYNVWVPLKSYINGSQIIGESYGFSIFQIMEFTETSTLSDVKIYPNPYKPNTSVGKINFSNMPAGTKIYVYTIFGELVKKLQANESGYVNWDGRNDNGNEISSGVYIVLFKNNGKKIIKKLAIER